VGDFRPAGAGDALNGEWENVMSHYIHQGIARLFANNPV
jgi:hypothetical protein